MNRRTKTLAISAAVKRHVYERDGGRCVLCGSIYGLPNAHYISRAQGGLGIKKNVVTLCPACHRAYDQTEARPEIKEELQRYLRSQYQDWDEADLIYKKWSMSDVK